MPMRSNRTNRTNRVRRLTRMLVAGSVAGFPTSASAQTPAPPPSLLAIENVTVIPMDRDRAVPGQTVLVRDGRIVSIHQSARVQVPAGATRVNGTGKYLIPGLADMHTHLFADWGHLPGSLLRPYHDLREWPPELDRDRPIAAICSSGQRSA